MIVGYAGWWVNAQVVQVFHFQVRCTIQPVKYWWGRYQVAGDGTMDKVMTKLTEPATLMPSSAFAAGGDTAIQTTSPAPLADPADATVPTQASYVVFIANCTPAEFIARNPDWTLA